MQLQINDGIAPITRNAASADIEGVELELRAMPAPGWLIQAGVGYLDASFDTLDPDENFVTDLRGITIDSSIKESYSFINLGIETGFFRV